jgi:glycosyltransferase involved in cell wall biosynthesis
MSQATKVLVVGQTPPPYGGQAIMIERFVNTPLEDIELIHARMGFSANMNEVGRVRLSKVIHLFGLIARIIYCRLVRGARILYYPPAGPDRVPMYRDVMTLLATRWMFDKTIFHYHAGGVSELYEQLPRWQRWFFRRAYFGVDAAIRISELTPEDGKLLKAKREFVIPNGIDDPCPEKDASCTPHTSIEPRPLRILFVGIIRESKGILDLAEACGRLAEQGVSFQLDVMGQPNSDEFMTRLRSRIAQLKLENKVRFLGVLTGAAKFAAYSQADVFCMPSFFNCETFGIVYLEAMAFGLPVVATRWRGIPSIVEHGKTGFLVPIHDPGAVADRLARLADDSELRQRMSIAGREKFEREYTWQRHAARMRRALLETAGMQLAAESAAPAPSCGRTRLAQPVGTAHDS